jgi:hypothetical protein
LTQLVTAFSGEEGERRSLCSYGTLRPGNRRLCPRKKKKIKHQTGKRKVSVHIQDQLDTRQKEEIENGREIQILLKFKNVHS